MNYLSKAESMSTSIKVLRLISLVFGNNVVDHQEVCVCVCVCVKQMFRQKSITKG